MIETVTRKDTIEPADNEPLTYLSYSRRISL
jgi:hypothetical protein